MGKPIRKGFGSLSFSWKQAPFLNGLAFFQIVSGVQKNILFFSSF